MSKHFILIEIPELPHAADNMDCISSRISELLLVTGVRNSAEAMSEDELEERFGPESVSPDNISLRCGDCMHHKGVPRPGK